MSAAQAQQFQPPNQPPARQPARPAPAALPPAQLEEALRLLLRADSSAQHHPAAGPEAVGLVLDQTLTKPGHDFFDLFTNQFEAPFGSEDYLITLTERPGRAGQGLLVLTVNELELLEFPLLTQPDQLAEAVAEAVATTQAQLLDNQRVSRQLEAGQRAPPETF